MLAASEGLGAQVAGHFADMAGLALTDQFSAPNFKLPLLKKKKKHVHTTEHGLTVYAFHQNQNTILELNNACSYSKFSYT